MKLNLVVHFANAVACLSKAFEDSRFFVEIYKACLLKRHDFAYSHLLFVHPCSNIIHQWPKNIIRLFNMHTLVVLLHIKDTPLHTLISYVLLILHNVMPNTSTAYTYLWQWFVIKYEKSLEAKYSTFPCMSTPVEVFYFESQSLHFPSSAHC